MAVYSTSYTWRALQELFEKNHETLELVLHDKTGEAFDEYLEKMVPGESKETLDECMKTLEHLAYQVSQTVENDFEVLKNEVKISPKVVQETFSPADCKKIIEAFEAGVTPDLTKNDLIAGVYLVLASGEKELKKFDVLDILIEAETPEAEEYQRMVDEKAAKEIEEAEQAEELPLESPELDSKA